jgi:hypothetical protein
MEPKIPDVQSFVHTKGMGTAPKDVQRTDESHGPKGTSFALGEDDPKWDGKNSPPNNLRCSDKS